MEFFAAHFANMVPDIKVNGVLLNLNTRTTLTLASDQDLAYFRKNDVVQTGGTGNADWNETQVWSSQIDADASLAFNGSTSDYWRQDQNTTNTWTTAGLPTLTSLVFKQPGTSDSFTLTID